MAHTLAVELECPECGALLTTDVSNCSQCGIEIDWSPGDESNKEDVEEMLEDILSRSGSKQAMGIESEESEDGPDDGPQGLSDGEVEQEDDLEILEEEEYEEAESEQITITDEIDDIESPPPMARRLYAKTFSTLGIITIALALLSLVGSIILLNWDTWVKGDANGSIGDTQRMAIYASVTITILFFAISTGDAYRNRNAARG